MYLSSIFGKLKGFGPALFVGSAVIITVKLLTTQTPTIQESLNIQAEEDIKTTSYEDEIKEPEPKKEPIQEMEEETEAAPEQEETSQEESAEEEQESQTESDTPEEKAKEEPQKPPKEQGKPRRWKSGTNNPMISLLQKLLPKKKE